MCLLAQAEVFLLLATGPSWLCHQTMSLANAHSSPLPQEGREGRRVRLSPARPGGPWLRLLPGDSGGHGVLRCLCEVTSVST